MSLLMVTVWGGDLYAWTSPVIIGLLVAGIGLLVAFVIWQHRAPEPILPPRLFGDPTFRLVAAALFLVTFALFAMMVFIPLFLQLVTGLSATRSGLLLIPVIVAMIAAQTVAGRVMSTTGRYKLFPVAGLTLMAVALFLMSFLSPTTPQFLVLGDMALFGLGMGMVGVVLTVALQNTAARQDLGIVSASANFFRALGGSVGVAVFGAVFNAGLRSRSVDPSLLESGRVSQAVLTAVTGALHAVFLIATLVALGALVLVALLREKPLSGAG